jgi:NADPH:quinone reductase-like Zn-dependent oxidoreductase
MLTINTVADLVMRNNTLKGWSTQETWMRKTSDEVKCAYVSELWELITSGKLQLPDTGQRFTFNQVGDAMSASVRPRRSGKVMLECTP